MTGPLAALFWGAVAGSALILGGLLGLYERFSSRTISLILALAGGVLIAMVAVELMEESYQQGGHWAAGIGVMAGALAYFVADWAVTRRGARNRKETEGQPRSESAGTALFVGTLLDGLPEAVALGVSLIKGGAVGWVLVVGIFLANVPEALSATVGMRRAGRTRMYVLGLWAATTVTFALASLLGYVLLSHVPAAQVALTQSFAAGAILAMLASTVFPEAFKGGGPLVGLLTSIGFLLAFFLSKLE